MRYGFYAVACGQRFCQRQRESLSNEMKLLQITEWLPQYQVPNLRSDVIAGVALAGLLIPEAMGYAVAIIPELPGDAPPPQLIDLLGQSA